jgi:hypothetical protein
MSNIEKTKRKTEEWLTCLIAENDKVPLDMVTVGYIEEQRQKRFYGSTRYNIGSSFGGHNLTGLLSLPKNKLDEIEKTINEIVQNQ